MKLSRKMVLVLSILSLLISSFSTPFSVTAADISSTENKVTLAMAEATGYKASEITFAPGKDASELNFAWYSNISTDACAVQIAKKDLMTGEEFPADATTFTGTVTPAVSGFYSNKVIVTGLAQSTKYVYRVGDGNDGNWSPVYEFTTNGTDSFSCLVVGDVQLGAGNTNQDILGWQDTMKKAVGQFPEVNFLLSLGDQVETGSNENEFTGFLSPAELRSLPVATLLGNHDNGSANYSYHFNVPNLSSEYGITESGSSDYFFTYNNTLIMVLNSNNNSCANHEAFIKETVEANPNFDWKVVMFHHDIYGSASHALDANIIALRQGLYPVFDKYGINLVLNGHDHSYTRTYMMYEDQPLPEQNVIGTLYITLNSGSGSKYYNLQPTPEIYAAVREQIKVPTFSKIDVTPETLTISTYRTDTMAMTDTYTISKETQKSLDLAKVTMTTDIDTLDSGNPANSVTLNVTAQDSNGTETDLSDAYIVYQTDSPDIVTIKKDSTDKTVGVVTINNAPALNKPVKVWAKVFNGSSFVESSKVEIQITVPYGLAEAAMKANDDTLSSSSSSLQLNLIGIDTLGAVMDISSATVKYYSNKDDILEISADGVVTVKNNPDRNSTVLITAEVTLDGKTVTSNDVSVTVMKAGGGGAQIVVPVKNALDDMEERADGTLDFDSSDLEMTWEKPDKDDVKNQLIGIRFADLNIPKGATVTDAYIQFSVDEPDKSFDPFNVDIYAEDVVNSVAFENVDGVVSAKFENKTTASVNWKDTPMWTVEHEADTDEQTPNLASLVQGIIEKDDWNEGNAICFLFSGSGNRTAESFEGAAGNVDQIPTLYVTYTLNENQIVVPVKNSLDDMEERADGTLDFDSSDLEMTWEKPDKDDVKNQLIGIRFADLMIPKGATIKDAFIQFSVDEPDKSFDPFNVDIYAEDVMNSAAFENVDGVVSAKFANKTITSVNWKDIPMWVVEHEADSDQQTPNLASLVQEIVNKDGWKEGNAISFLFSGSGNRTVESFEGAEGNVEQIPTLHVIYSLEKTSTDTSSSTVTEDTTSSTGTEDNTPSTGTEDSTPQTGTEDSNTYTVVEGDSLSEIAKRILNDAKLWEKIYELNKDTIKNPNLIYPEQIIVLP